LLRDEASNLAYWTSKPAVAGLGLDFPPVASAADRATVAHMKRGEFRPSAGFPWLPIGVPPPWGENPLGQSAWDHYRHALTWLMPLVNVWLADGDGEAGELVFRVIADWQKHNAVYPGASPYSWHDHESAARIRNCLRIWGLYRRSTEPDESRAAMLLGLIHAHAEFVAGGRTYAPRSNHGFVQNVSLIEAAVCLPEFHAAETWRAVGDARMAQYVQENFSAVGFHLEQSPGYHRFVGTKLGALVKLLAENGQAPVPGLAAAARRAVAVWPYLLLPDGRVVNVGDTHVKRYRSALEGWPVFWDPNDVPQLGYPSHVLLDFAAGYAVFTACDPALRPRDPDTYVLFKCNAFEYTHAQRDALSFVLYGHGQSWLIDSGLYNYEEKDPARQYMRSARAHNVVLVDDVDHGFGQTALVASEHTAQADSAAARHELPRATHVRTLRFTPPAALDVLDELRARDEKPHRYTQLFHASPDLEVQIESERVIELRAKNGAACRIEQLGAIGQWQMITGQKVPYWQGWYSADVDQLVPAPVLTYSVEGAPGGVTFNTRITLISE
jgi:hypothetical protein